MKTFLHRLRTIWSRHEFVRAGIYATLGAVVAANWMSHPKPNGLVDLLDSAHATEQPPPILDNTTPPAMNKSIASSKFIQTVGLPQTSHLRIYDGFVCAYDRRNRIPLWTMEILTPAKLNSAPYQSDGSPQSIDRRQFDFFEDPEELPVFRSTNADYLNSGFDRGHMAAAGNHRFEHKSMQQTFVLSNVAPQVGVGFNRHAWNDLEKYVRAIVRNSNTVVVITGPLFLHRVENGKKFVQYEVIGPNNIAVPTHFFKAIAIQQSEGSAWRTAAWVLPNAALPEKVNLKAYQVPIPAVERASGLKLFPGLPPS